MKVKRQNLQILPRETRGHETATLWTAKVFVTTSRHAVMNLLTFARISFLKLFCSVLSSCAIFPHPHPPLPSPFLLLNPSPYLSWSLWRKKKMPVSLLCAGWSQVRGGEGEDESEATARPAAAPSQVQGPRGEIQKMRRRWFFLVCCSIRSSPLGNLGYFRISSSSLSRTRPERWDSEYVMRAQ